MSSALHPTVTNNQLLFVLFFFLPFSFHYYRPTKWTWKTNRLKVYKFCTWWYASAQETRRWFCRSTVLDTNMDRKCRQPDNRLRLINGKGIKINMLVVELLVKCEIIWKCSNHWPHSSLQSEQWQLSSQVKYPETQTADDTHWNWCDAHCRIWSGESSAAATIHTWHVLSVDDNLSAACTYLEIIYN